MMHNGKLVRGAKMTVTKGTLTADVIMLSRASHLNESRAGQPEALGSL
jgi:aromatic ring hydroxylase